VKNFILRIIIGICLVFPLKGLNASESEHKATEDKEFNANEFIFDHIADSHEFHIATLPNDHHITVPLPVILYSKKSGLNIFLSSKLAHGHEYKGFELKDDGEYKGKIIEHTEDGELYVPLDFSITKNVFSMLLTAILILWLFISLGNTYRKTGISEPKGIQGFIEPLILFIRDDIALMTIGKEKYEKFMPYLLTSFFFIWISNMIGIIPFFPFGANVTGNIAVTMVLAMFTFVITQVSAGKDYWKHIVAMPGVPFWLAPIMIPLEIIGLISKPFALMIRLFANITAGHIIILSIISLIFIFKSIFVAPASIAFVLFMDVIEMLVAVLQAYVFTLLSALFIGLAVKEEH
jgi:F-type H+-transporting ATPase subunit a